MLPDESDVFMYAVPCQHTSEGFSGIDTCPGKEGSRCRNGKHTHEGVCERIFVNGVAEQKIILSALETVASRTLGWSQFCGFPALLLRDALCCIGT